MKVGRYGMVVRHDRKIVMLVVRVPWLGTGEWWHVQPLDGSRTLSIALRHWDLVE